MKLASITDTTASKRKAHADNLRRLADEVERGDISEYVIVANNVRENCFYTEASFDDRWRILGALEYAKAGIHRDAP